MKSFLKRKLAWIGICLFIVLISTLIGFNIERINQNGQEKLVITIGNPAYASGNPDYICDGIADDIQFQGAMNSLPVTGGKLVILGGTYVLTATVTRLIDNVTIEGMGRGTYITGGVPNFTAGGNNWVFQDIRTDAGNINMGATTGWIWRNVTINVTTYSLRTETTVGTVTTGGITGTSITDSGLNDTQVVYSGAGGLLSSEAAFAYNSGTNTLTTDNLDAPTGRGATITVAASDSSTLVKNQSDYVCTGTHDFTTTVLTALNLLKTTGGTLILQAGNYADHDTTSIDVTQWAYATQIIGYGAVLTFTGINGTYALSLSGDVSHPYSQFTIEGLTIIGNATADGGILLSNVVGATIKRCTINYFSQAAKGYGIELTDSGINCSEYNTISNCFIMRNQVGFYSHTVNSAANTSIENTTIVLAPANNAQGVKLSTSFMRSLLSNVVVQMGRDDVGNGQVAFYINAYTQGTVFNACSVDDAGTTPTGGMMIQVDGKTGGLTIINFQWARAGTNTDLFTNMSADDYAVKWISSANSGSDTTLKGDSNDSNIFYNGDFGNGFGMWTTSNVNLTFSTDTKVGGHSMLMTANGAVGNAYYEIPTYARYKGKFVTVSFYYKDTSTNTQTQLPNITDGVASTNYGVFSKDDTWHYRELRKFVSSTAVLLRLTFYIGIGAADFDDTLLISGIQVNDGLNGVSFTPYNGVSGFINSGEVRTVSGSLYKSGTKLTNGTGTLTESGTYLIPGVNQLHITGAGTFTVTLPTGTTGTAFGDGAGGYANIGGTITLANALVLDSGATTGHIDITLTCIPFAWHNPEAQDIYIQKVVIAITTKGGTATAELEVGIADNTVGLNRGTEFYNTLDLDAAASVHDSTIAGTAGTQTVWVACQDSASATDGWVVGQGLTEKYDGLVGSYYVTYCGQ